MAHLCKTANNAAEGVRVRDRKETAHYQIQERADCATRLAQRQGGGWTTILMEVTDALSPDTNSDPGLPRTSNSPTLVQVTLQTIAKPAATKVSTRHFLDYVKGIRLRLRDLRSTRDSMGHCPFSDRG